MKLLSVLILSSVSLVAANSVVSLKEFVNAMPEELDDLTQFQMWRSAESSLAQGDGKGNTDNIHLKYPFSVVPLLKIG